MDFIMYRHRPLLKERLSTKDRFVSILKGGHLPDTTGPAWYRQRGNFFILLMILVFFALTVVVKSFILVQDTDSENLKNESAYSQEIDPVDEEEMDIDEAKRIFGSTGESPSEQK